MRIGARPVLVAGGLLWGAAVFWFVARVGITPDFVGEWLPGILLLGLGAGTLLPNLTAAAVASAPGAGYATATGLNSVARQIGAALGVALVVAILGTPSPAEAAAAFDRAWTFGAACFIVAGLGCLLVGRRTGVELPSLASAARAVLIDEPTSAAPASAAADREEADEHRSGIVAAAAGRDGRRVPGEGADVRRPRTVAPRHGGGTRAPRERGRRRLAVPRGRCRGRALHRPRRPDGDRRRGRRHDDPRDRSRGRRRRARPAHRRTPRGVGAGRARSRSARRLSRRLRGAAPRLPRPAARVDPHARRAAARDAPACPARAPAAGDVGRRRRRRADTARCDRRAARRRARAPSVPCPSRCARPAGADRRRAPRRPLRPAARSRRGRARPRGPQRRKCGG